MTQRDEQLRNLAHLFTSALVDTHNATVKFEVLVKEDGVHKGTKKQLHKCLTELKQIRQRFDKYWGEEGKRVMDEQILSEDDTLQIQHITHLVMELPKGIRNQVEQYTESLLKVYASKPKS